MICSRSKNGLSKGELEERGSLAPQLGLSFYRSPLPQVSLPQFAMLLVGLRNVYSGAKEEPGSGSDWVRADAHFLETEEMCVQLLSLGFHIEQLVREQSQATWKCFLFWGVSGKKFLNYFLQRNFTDVNFM